METKYEQLKADVLDSAFRDKTQKKSAQYLPIVLGGLWKDETISDEDIDDIRKEKWQSVEKREL